MDSVFEENPLASSIRLKRRARKVHVISLYLYNNAGTIYISYHTQYTYPQYTYPRLQVQFLFGILFKIDCNLVCPPPFLLGRVEIPTKFSKSQRLVGFQFLEEIAMNEGVIFFRVVAVFTKSLQTKTLSGFKSAQLISFTCHEHVASDHFIEINNLCTMIQNNLICVYFKIINITIKTYIQQSYASFHL